MIFFVFLFIPYYKRIKEPNMKSNVDIKNAPAVSETHQLNAPKKRRRHKGKFKPNFNIPGVQKIILSYTTQESIGCVVGDNVTAEKPWINIDKEVIIEDIELLAEDSIFFPFKEELLQFPGTKILMGYIPDESSDVDEFYICLTEDATYRASKIVDKLKRIQEESLQRALMRKPKPWPSFGSEAEIEENQIKYNRNLLEVEIESIYPIKLTQICFHLIKAGDMKDGFMELKAAEDPQLLYRKRINASVQVTPEVIEKEAQTVCIFPKNSYTKYLYEAVVDPETTTNFDNIFKNFFDKNGDFIFDALLVNSHIDIYFNDYEKLVLNPASTMKVSMPRATEYLVFIDMELCQSKMISSIAWHPLWTGCCVASYVTVAPPLYLNSGLNIDEVYQAVHDTHPVLFWSFNDDLKPKLILETPRPVYALSCCPYNENLVIGGCTNGQIIIWDITNKLSRVEEEEILTVEQQSYRLLMWSLMTWMKNVFNPSVVRPTALSDLKYSHKGCVNQIYWMSPFQATSNTGKIDPVEKSLQFISSGQGGCIMIWDLLKKPTYVRGGFKAIRTMRRLKKRPSALSQEESSFKQLHLNLKPIYRINIGHVLENNRLLSISSFFAVFYEAPFVKETYSKYGRRSIVKLVERAIYKPVLDPQYSKTRKTFIIGTMEGDMIQAEWEGLDFDSGEVVNYENCQFISHGKYHDGPVIRVDYSPITNAILSVGGKIFAVWREDFLNRPIIWRQTSTIYTDGGWFQFEKVSIKLIRIDGYIEIWNLNTKSRAPTHTALTTNGPVTLITTHPRQMQFNVTGLCDYRGSFRMFYTRFPNPTLVETDQKNMSLFLDKEVQRKKEFLKWQTDWNENKRVKVEANIENNEEEPFEPTETSKKPEKKKVAKISPGLRYMEIVQEETRINVQKRIKRLILEKKQLDTDKLIKQRKPLTDLEKEDEIKKHKQRNKLKTSDVLFKDTVAMHFPEVNVQEPPPPPNPYEAQFSVYTKQETYKTFQQLSIDAQDYVEDNPFKADFNWAKVLKIGCDRRKKLNDGWERVTHHLRYQKIKEEKAKDLAEAKEALESENKSTAASLQTTSEDVRDESLLGVE